MRVRTEWAEVKADDCVIRSYSHLDCPKSDWDGYVDSHLRGSVYHRVSWGDIISSSFNHKPIYITAYGPDGRLVGVLPIFDCHSIFGHALVSIPFCNFGGAIGNSEDIESKLMREAIRNAQEIGANRVEFRDDFRR